MIGIAITIDTVSAVMTVASINVVIGDSLILRDKKTVTGEPVTVFKVLKTCEGLADFFDRLEDARSDGVWVTL